MIRRGGAPGPQTLIGIGLLVVAGVVIAGAMGFPSSSGYSGVGPNFLPWVVAGNEAWHAHVGIADELEYGVVGVPSPKFHE